MPESLYTVLVGLVAVAALNVRLVRQLRAGGRGRKKKGGMTMAAYGMVRRA
jgi:hypothetical protein